MVYMVYRLYMANSGECVAITVEEGADGTFKGEWVSELDGRCAMRVVINGHRGSFAVKTEAGLSGSLLLLRRWLYHPSQCLRLGFRWATEVAMAPQGSCCPESRAPSSWPTD